jgi:hypothetical protein
MNMFLSHVVISARSVFTDSKYSSRARTGQGAYDMVLTLFRKNGAASPQDAQRREVESDITYIKEHLVAHPVGARNDAFCG